MSGAKSSHTKIVGKDGEEVGFSPVDGFKVIHTELTAAGPNYMLYVDVDGNWYVMKEVIAGDERTYTFYYEDASDLGDAWTDRASHTYVEFNAAF